MLNNLKRPLVTLAITVGLLAVAGPASAQAYSALPEGDANANFFEEAAHAKEPLSFGLAFEHLD
jgi:hypothetical protein